MLLRLPKKPGLFITATDTNVGKTLVAGAIARILTNQHLNVATFKPIATGCRHTREGLVNSDAEFLAWCSNSKFPLSVINPITYAIPAAPALCERLEHKKIDFEIIKTSYQYICDNSDLVIVEGIGGIKVPLSENIELRDIAASFNLPTVIVARPNLGTLNHTLLTIESCRNANINIAGVIITPFSEPKADFAYENAAKIIEEFGNVEILAVLPYDESTDTENCIVGSVIINELEKQNWQRIAGLK